jgi:hypothetical protein
MSLSFENVQATRILFLLLAPLVTSMIAWLQRLQLSSMLTAFLSALPSGLRAGVSSELVGRALWQVLTGSLAYLKSVHELASVLVSGFHTSWVFWRFDLDQDNCLQASEVEKYVECYFDKALADAPLQHRHLRCTHLAQALIRAHDKNLDRKLSRAEYLALVLDNVIGAQLSLYFWDIFPQQLPKHDEPEAAPQREHSLRRRLRAFGTLMAQIWKKSTATSETFVKSFESLYVFSSIFGGASTGRSRPRSESKTRDGCPAPFRELDDEEVKQLFKADHRRCSRDSRRKTWHT